MIPMKWQILFSLKNKIKVLHSVICCKYQCALITVYCSHQLMRKKDLQQKVRLLDKVAKVYCCLLTSGTVKDTYLHTCIPYLLWKLTLQKHAYSKIMKILPPKTEIFQIKILGPVVQSVVSLTSSLRVISLTVLVDSIYNILIFFAEKMWVAFALQKLLTFFQQKNSAYLCITGCKF